jgi:hypothetical protein
MQGIKDQLPREVASAIFRNFGTFISFRLGEPDDAQQVNRSMPSEVLEESDYLNVEPYYAYMRMQVGNERTRPFLIRMKAPGPAQYEEVIPVIKERTIAEAMMYESKAIEDAARVSEVVEERTEENELFVGEEEQDKTTIPESNQEVAAATELFVEDKEDEITIDSETSNKEETTKELTPDDLLVFGREDNLTENQEDLLDDKSKVVSDSEESDDNNDSEKGEEQSDEQQKTKIRNPDDLFV